MEVAINNIGFLLNYSLSKTTPEMDEAPLCRHFAAAQPLAAPFGDRMQRRVLQELRTAPFEPSMWRLAQLGMELFN
jgi:hypothetical protein